MRLLFVLILLFPQLIFAQTKINDILIQANEIERNLEKKSVTLRGNVKIIYKDYIIGCEQATLDVHNRVVEAKGEVVLDDVTTHIEGDQLIYNLNTKRGTIYNGFIKSGSVVFSGKIIEKTDDKTYWSTDGQFTACDTCPPAWSFSGTEIEAELGGYADIKFPVLRIANFPVFFLPRLLVPLKSERESGFLVPSLDYSQDKGTAISLIYFWAISRSQDLTLTATHYQLRGLKPLFDYRYVLDENSQGRLKFAFISDKAFEKFENSETENFSRWMLNYEHYYKLPNNFTQRAELNFLSDLRYLRDFPDDLGSQGNPALNNSFSLTRNGLSQHFSIKADYFVNLLKTNPLESNNDAVHKFPEINYSVNKTNVFETPLLLNFNANYTHFARDYQSYDDLKTQTEFDNDVALACGGLTGGDLEACKDNVSSIKDQPDGQFDPTQDIIRTGQRLELNPRISYPFQLGSYFSLLPTLSYRETHYAFDPQSKDYEQITARRYLRSDISLKTQFSRIFQTDDKDITYKHKVEPEIVYSQVPWSNLPDHPFFGNFQDVPIDKQNDPISESDFGGQGEVGRGRVQFDYRDRFFDRRIATWGIINRVTKRTSINKNNSYKNVLTFALYQSYDFKEAEEQKPYPWSAISGYLNANHEYVQLYSSYKYFPYAKRTSSSSRLRIPFLGSSYTEFTYNRNFSITEDNKINTESLSEIIGLNLGIKNDFIDIVGSLNYNGLSYEVTPWALKTKITPPGDCWSITFEVFKAVNSDPIYKFNLDFEFGGV